jgi:hypothetical protein
MSQKDDVIFCKIAITNGLVSEAQAQKVLSICQKRENEQGRRPPIGDVFAKYNLMKTQDVRRIYEAVSKRTGKPVPATSSRDGSATTRRNGGKTTTFRRAGATTARLRPPDRQPKEGRGIDPTTLWMGISGLVVFLGVIVTISYLVFFSSGSDTEKPATVSSESSSSGGRASGGTALASPQESTKSPAAPASVPAAPKAAEKPKAAAKASIKNLPKEIINMIDSSIADAKSESDPHVKLQKLEALKNRLEERGYEDLPKKLLDDIGLAQEEAKQAPVAPAESAPADSGADAAPSEPLAPADLEKDDKEAPEPKEDADAAGSK